MSLSLIFIMIQNGVTNNIEDVIAKNAIQDVVVPVRISFCSSVSSVQPYVADSFTISATFTVPRCMLAREGTIGFM